MAGRVHLRLTGTPADFLMTSHLRTGLGSSGLTFDRGMQGKTHRMRLERTGPVAALVRLNKRWTSGGDVEQRRAGEDSFVRSVVHAGPVLRLEADDVLDITEWVVGDHLGIAAELAMVGEGSAVLDRARSYLDAADSSVWQRSTELSAWLSFAVTEPGERLREVSPDPHCLSFGIRLSLIPLPEGFVARAFDPAAGGFGKGYADLGAHPADGVTVLLQPRFRVSPGHPIVVNVDPGIPEPYRSAVVEGGSWWVGAFERAGLDGAFRVRVLPEDVDPFAAGTTMVWWVHRTGRGWSRAAASVDVRTGEILHANVRLGSQRLHQLQALFEALLSPYGHPDEAERLAEIEAAVRARLRLLAAHEIGHALGFVHNYASTAHPAPSAMDYPHPRLRVVDGRIVISEAYQTGLGPWDDFVVRAAYGEAMPQDDAPVLPFISDADGHDPDAAVPEGVPWTFGSDAMAALQTMLGVRALALEEFGAGVVAPGRPASDIEGRFYLVYLAHRHQAQAVARLVGGASFGYATAGSGRLGTREVPASTQHAAVEALCGLLRVDVLDVPEHVRALLTPPPLRYGRSADAPAASAGGIFDLARAAEIGAGVTLVHVFRPGRLNRLWDQAARGLGVPTVGGLVTAIGRVCLESEAARPDHGMRAAEPALRAGIAWAFGRHVIAASDDVALHPWARREVVTAVASVLEESEADGCHGAVAALREALAGAGRAAVGSPVPPPQGVPL